MAILRSDFIVPFQLEKSPVRGRLLRLSSVLDEIISKHNYPEQVSALLAEAVTLVALLGSWLKYDGIFTLQAQGNGPLNLLVADYTSQGTVRGYARFNTEKLSVVPNTFRELLGEGFLSFTIDQGGNSERYQGIVSIEGNSLTEAIHHYFAQSEQLRTEFRIAVEKHGNHWHAGAISIQALPEEGGFDHLPPKAGSPDAEFIGADDPVPADWQTASALLGTITPHELLNKDLHPHDLLFRLFHELGVRGFPEINIRHACRCSRERVQNILSSLTTEEQNDLIENGTIEFTCEFCNSHYKFTAEDLQKS